MRVSRRLPAPARRDVGRARHQFRAVLGQRREGRAVPVRPARPPRARAHCACPSTPTTSGTAICRDVAAGPALRLSRARPLRARAGPPLQSQQAAARSLRQAAGRPDRLERRAFRLSRRQPARTTCRSTVATMRAACRRRWWSTRPSPGATTARPHVPWHDTIIYEAHVKGLTMLREDVPPGWRGLVQRPRRAGADRSSASGSA